MIRLAAVLAALSLFAAGCGSGAREPSAADQVPALATSLERVDAALASHRFGAARQQLRAMKSVVVKARDAGDLREADAQRVLDAIARLMRTLPDERADAPATSDPSPRQTTGPTVPSEPDPGPPEQTATPGSTPAEPTPTTSSPPSPTASSSPSTEPTTTSSASPTAVATTPP